MISWQADWFQKCKQKSSYIGGLLGVMQIFLGDNRFFLFFGNYFTTSASGQKKSKTVKPCVEKRKGWD